eukprot:scaffold1428_cov159-Amphora_coffeaeformis.AAC.5
MENDGDSKTSDDFDQLEHSGPHDGAVGGLDDVNPVDGQEDGIDEVAGGINRPPDDHSPEEPDKKRPRMEDPVFDEEIKTPKEEAMGASRTVNSLPHQASQANTPQQQQAHPMANTGYAMPMPGMGYSPMAFPPMMMNPQMYGFNPYYNPAAAAPPAYGRGTDKTQRGEAKEGVDSPQPGPTAANPAMNAAVAAAMMYNPYMMQHFQGMMNSIYPRQGFPPMFNPNSAGNTRRGISLSLSVDSEMLSEYQLLVRQQLELFEAGPEDVESNTQGRKKQVAVGQVGLRCKHCAAYPLRARGRGAVYYPAKLSGTKLFCLQSDGINRVSPKCISLVVAVTFLGIYQAAQNMAGSHLCQSCQQIPPLIKAELQKLRERRDNASGGKQYWADGCLALGVYETDQGLRLSSQTSANGEGDSKIKKEDTNDEPSADAV